jgi:serine/threonine-protein kinase
MPELILSVLQREPTPLHELRPEITPDFDAVVRRCLRKNPGERFADVGALALAIAPFGPPGSQVSVDRILHVLRDSYKPPGHSGPPRDVVSPPLLPLAVSPAASTLPRPLLLHDEKERSHARLGPAEAASGGRTTSKPVSSDPMHVVSVPAQTGRWLAPLLGVLVVASGAAGIATWRATLAPKGSAPTQSASPSPSPEAPRGAPTPPAVVGPAPSSAATASPAAASQSASTAPPPSIVTQGRPTPIHPAHAPAAAPMPTIAPVPVPAASRPPVADCDPPYTFNAYGSRVYKKECMK